MAETKSTKATSNKQASPPPGAVAGGDQPEPAEKYAVAAEPTGRCDYTDAFGHPECASPVTKGFCDDKGGVFTEGGECG